MCLRTPTMSHLHLRQLQLKTLNLAVEYLLGFTFLDSFLILSLRDTRLEERAKHLQSIYRTVQLLT